MREHNEIVFDEDGEVVSIETTSPQPSKNDEKDSPFELVEKTREILTGLL